MACISVKIVFKSWKAYKTDSYFSSKILIRESFYDYWLADWGIRKFVKVVRPEDRGQIADFGLWNADLKSRRQGSEVGGQKLDCRF